MANEFNFKTYQPPRGAAPSGGVVWVTRTRLNLGKAVYEGLGSPPRISFAYDTRAKAIKLAGAPEGEGLKATHPAGRLAVLLSVREKVLSQLPIGVYLPIGGGIFVHESEQR